MFNIGGGEVLVIALLALIVVGPEQLPGVLRKAGRYATQVRSMTTGLRDEFMAGIDEIDPNNWVDDEENKIEGRGSGTADSPIVPRGYADRHDETKDERPAYGAGRSSVEERPIKPRSAEMTDAPPAEHTASADDTPEPEHTGAESEVANASEPVAAIDTDDSESETARTESTDSIEDESA